MTYEAARSALDYSRGYSMGVLWRNMAMELDGGGINFAEQTEDFFDGEDVDDRRKAEACR